MSKASGAFLLAWLALGLAAGCAPVDEASDAGPSEEPAPAVDVYEPGITKSAGELEVELIEASPAPPDVGNNVWQLAVRGPGGEPVEGAVVIVSPFMPEHGHGTSPADYEGVEEEGVYEVGPFNLFMPGRWDVTVVVEDEGAGLEDEVLFRFLLEG